MMNYLLLIPGIVILIGVVCDLAYTTFSSNGAGYITDVITKGLWHLSLKLCHNDGSKKLLEYIGIITIGIIIITWFLLIWLGSTLIVEADPFSVVESTTNAATNTIEKAYYTGYTLTTLGIGDYKPNTDFWRLFTVLLSFTGFMLITTAVSYMLPVLSADVFKKSISKKIFILGVTPQEILLNHWKDGSFKELENYFSDLTDMIITHSQQLLAYPILYNFHNAHIEKSSTVSIAVLDEALTILLLHIPEENRPSDQSIAPVRKAIAKFLNVLGTNFIYEAATNPPLPQTELLKKAGIPFSENAYSSEGNYKKFSKRRQLIEAILNNEGWKFNVIEQPKPDPEEELD